MKTTARITALLLCFVAVIAVFCGCNGNEQSKTESPAAGSSVAESSVAEAESSTAESSLPADESSKTDESIIGEGETEFFFKVVDAEGKETLFTIHTDEKTVGKALLDAGLIAGDESQYGLYVKTVNGVTVDYDTDKAYWAFYIGDEYASTGVDSTDIEAGKTYTFQVETG